MISFACQIFSVQPHSACVLLQSSLCCALHVQTISSYWCGAKTDQTGWTGWSESLLADRSSCWFCCARAHYTHPQPLSLERNYGQSLLSLFVLHSTDTGPINAFSFINLVEYWPGMLYISWNPQSLDTRKHAVIILKFVTMWQTMTDRHPTDRITNRPWPDSGAVCSSSVLFDQTHLSEYLGSLQHIWNQLE